VRGGSKTLPIALAIALVVTGLAACGGGSSSNTTTQAGTQAQAGAPGESAAQTGGSGGSGGKAEGQGSSGSGGGSAGFTPKHHADSGGGSQQFEVKGGDNSVQEFGAEAGGSEFEEVAATLHDFLDARAAENWSAACAYMAKSVTESLVKLGEQAKDLRNASCATVFAKLINAAAAAEFSAEAAQADVGSVRIKGDQAFLIYRGPNRAVLAMPMTREGGGWKVTSLAGTPLG
jgi:hypothetical protein